MREFGEFKVRSDRQRDPATGHRRSVGTRIEGPGGTVFRLQQFPKRVTDVQAVEGGGVAVELDGGKRRKLLEPVDALVESGRKQRKRPEDRLVESAKLSEDLLEAAFLREDAPEPLDAVLQERGGASEAEMQARARSYPAHGGGIGSSKAEPIGKGKGRKYPPGFQHIRNALIRAGHSVAEASKIAYGSLRRWRRGGGNVKKSTRAKAAKVLGQLAGGKGRAIAVREAAVPKLKAAVRNRDDGAYAALIGEWLDDGRPVSEDPATLRECAERITTGTGPLRPRSDTDRRVLETQRQIGLAAQEEAMAEHEAPVSAVNVFTEAGYTPAAEPEPVKPEGPQVVLELPPRKAQSRNPSMLVEGEEIEIGEAKVTRALSGMDFEDLKDRARILYARTAQPTYPGKTYIESAGRTELTGIVASLQEAFGKPCSDSSTSDEASGEEPLTEADADLMPAPAGLGVPRPARPSGEVLSTRANVDPLGDGDDRPDDTHRQSGLEHPHIGQLREERVDDAAMESARAVLREAHRRGRVDAGVDGTMNQQADGPDPADMSVAELRSAHRHHRGRERAHRKLAEQAGSQDERARYENLANQHMGHAGACSSEYMKRRGHHMHPADEAAYDQNVEPVQEFGLSSLRPFPKLRVRVTMKRTGRVRESEFEPHAARGYGERMRGFGHKVEYLKPKKRAAIPAYEPSAWNESGGAPLAECRLEVTSGGRKRHRAMRSPERAHRIAEALRRKGHDVRVVEAGAEEVQEARRHPKRHRHQRPKLRKHQQVRFKHRGRHHEGKFIGHHKSGEHAIVHSDGKLLSVPHEAIVEAAKV